MHCEVERFCMRPERNRTGAACRAGLELVRFGSVSRARPRAADSPHDAVPIPGNDGVGPLSCAAPTLANCHEPTRALIRAKKWLPRKGRPEVVCGAVRVRGALDYDMRHLSLFNFSGHGS
jgi:hypothetical protein